jgi:GATA-binding protein
MFQQALNGEVYHSHSPSLYRAPSPANSSLNGLDAPPLPYESLAAQNTALKTRVSEMELINDLFRNRVSELEGSENAARETEAKLRAELDEVRMREAELKRRLDEFEDEGPRHKKPRFSDLVDETRAGSPINALLESSMVE